MYSSIKSLSLGGNMAKKKLLILGANPETVSLIKKAKELGLYTIVTDNNPKAYAKRYADQAENIDATDVNKLVALALREKVQGVVVGVAEALLPAYCEVCERLNLPCYSTKDKFELLTHKDLFKETCKKYQVPTIEEYRIEDKSMIQYPVIVKPVDSCSSKGITVCATEKELDKAVLYAKSYSSSGRILVEKYMHGDEVIAYYVIQDGHPIFVGMCDRYTYRANPESVQLPTAYIFPSKYVEAYLNYTDSAIKNMIKGIGLANGSIFFQCFVDDQGVVRTYEAGYRLNGAQEHLIISKFTGIDAKELYINFALTGKATEDDLELLNKIKIDKIACKLSPLVTTGKIFEIKGLEKIKQFPDVVSVNPSYDIGDEVTGEGTLKQIVCRFFIVSANKLQLLKTINKIYETFEVLNEKGKSMLIGKFDTKIIYEQY